MRLLNRAVMALAAGALTAGLVGLPVTAGATTGTGQESATTSQCSRAHSRTTHAHHKVTKAVKAVRKARARLSAAKAAHRPAKVKKARHHLAVTKKHRTKAKKALKRARAAEHRACTPATGGGTGGTTTPPASTDPTAALGSLLGLLAGGAGGGSVPSLDPTQLTGLLGALYPGASTSGLDASQLASAFNSAGTLDQGQLAALLGGLPDQFGSLSPSTITDLFDGGGLSAGSAADGLSMLTALFNAAGGSGATMPANPLGALTSLLGPLCAVLPICP